jgi:diaminopimelate decarboxylase
MSFSLRDGVLHCEQVPLPAIAEAAGTPAYVYASAAMRGQAEALQRALAPLGDVLIAFAVKANPNGAVLATMAGLGLGADVVSIGEYRRARAAGIAADRIVFSGVGKTAAELREALAGGVRQINLESVAEAEMLAQVASATGREAPVAIRVNPDVGAGGHAKISTGAAHNKFGVPIAEAMAAFERARSLPNLRIQGVAVHIGSQITDLAPLEAAYGRIGELVAALRAAGHAIDSADLGGGLGIAYRADAAPPPPIEDYGVMVARVAGSWGTRLIFEPGRLLVGNAGVLLTRVIRTKPGPSCPFLVVDAAMNDLIRPTLYDAWHEVRAVVPRGERMIADVVGPVCETGDTFALAREMDKAGPGDLLAIMGCGAYAATMANSYNSRPQGPEIMVNGRDWAIVRERQTVDDLVRLERLPGWLA